MHVERGLAEEMVAALAAELEQGALDRADATASTTLPYWSGQLVGRARRNVDQHRLQIVEVEQQQPLLVGDV